MVKSCTYEYNRYNDKLRSFELLCFTAYLDTKRLLYKIKLLYQYY